MFSFHRLHQKTPSLLSLFIPLCLSLNFEMTNSWINRTPVIRFLTKTILPLDQISVTGAHLQQIHQWLSIFNDTLSYKNYISFGIIIRLGLKMYCGAIVEKNCLKSLTRGLQWLTLTRGPQTKYDLDDVSLMNFDDFTLLMNLMKIHSWVFCTIITFFVRSLDRFEMKLQFCLLLLFI